MSQVDTLPARNPLGFSLSSSPPVSTFNESTLSWRTSALVNDIFAAPAYNLNGASDANPNAITPITATSGAPGVASPQTENIFPSLPPLLHGHSDIHLRNGIMNASIKNDAHEPDAERAFFVADLSQVYRQHQRWRACLPEIQPFYAVKCNPDPYVIRLLAALGAGFDCASNGEISQVLSVGGIHPSRIIFANPCKAVSFIRSAAREGVDMMTFDNADELYKISRAHPKAKCVVRILTDDSKSLCAFGIKFGAPLSTVPGLLAKARELGLDVIGVSFHVGSGCYDPSVYTDAIRRARDVFQMAEEVGYTFTLLDVGGGFEDALFEEAAGYIKEAISVYFPKGERERRGMKVIAEPGRFYVSRAFRLAANIIARRAPMDGKGPAPQPPPPPPSEDGDKKKDAPSVMYYINDGVYGAFNCILFDHQVVHPYVLSMANSFHLPSHQDAAATTTNSHGNANTNPDTLALTATPQTELVSIWGPTCDSIDCVCPSTTLPVGLSVGDWLGFDNMGAYTVCAASMFNGFELSRVVYTTGPSGGGMGDDVRRVLVAFAGMGYGL